MKCLISAILISYIAFANDVYSTVNLPVYDKSSKNPEKEIINQQITPLSSNRYNNSQKIDISDMFVKEDGESIQQSQQNDMKSNEQESPSMNAYSSDKNQLSPENRLSLQTEKKLSVENLEKNAITAQLENGRSMEKNSIFNANNANIINNTPDKQKSTNKKKLKIHQVVERNIESMKKEIQKTDNATQKRNDIVTNNVKEPIKAQEIINFEKTIKGYSYDEMYDWFNNFYNFFSNHRDIAQSRIFNIFHKVLQNKFFELIQILNESTMNILSILQKKYSNHKNLQVIPENSQEDVVGSQRSVDSKKSQSNFRKIDELKHCNDKKEPRPFPVERASNIGDNSEIEKSQNLDRTQRIFTEESMLSKSDHQQDNKSLLIKKKKNQHIGDNDSNQQNKNNNEGEDVFKQNNTYNNFIIETVIGNTNPNNNDDKVQSTYDEFVGCYGDLSLHPIEILSIKKFLCCNYSVITFRNIKNLLYFLRVMCEEKHIQTILQDSLIDFMFYIKQISQSIEEVVSKQSCWMCC